MSVTDEKAESLFQEVMGALDKFSKDLWGFKGIGSDGVLLVGNKISDETRGEVIAELPSFADVYFLSGLSRKDYQKGLSLFERIVKRKENYQQGPSLVQHVLMYGGTLPGWEWCNTSGEWKEYPECSIATITVVSD